MMSKNSTENAAFNRAISHSKRVTFVKRTLPVLALGGLMIGGAVINIADTAPEIDVDLANSSISDGKLVMANPKLDGFTTERKPYRVTANRAIQDLTGSSAIELDTLRADVELENGQSARLTSATGTFDSVSNILVLPQQGVLTMSDGLRADFGRADINIGSGAVNASQNISIANEGTTITATKMQIIDSGKQIIFEENVRVVLTPKSNETALNGSAVN